MQLVNLPTPSFDNLRKMKPEQKLFLLLAVVVCALIIIKAKFHLLAFVIGVYLVLSLCGGFMNKNEEEERQKVREENQREMNLKTACAVELQIAISKNKEFYKKHRYYPGSIESGEMQALIRAIVMVYRICEIELGEEVCKRLLLDPLVTAEWILPYVKSGKSREVRDATNSFILYLGTGGAG